MNPVAVEMATAVKPTLIEPEAYFVRGETFRLLGGRHHICKQRICARRFRVSERANHQSFCRRDNQLAVRMREAKLLIQSPAIGRHVARVIKPRVGSSFLKIRELLK